MFAASNAENLLIEFDPSDGKRLRSLSIFHPIALLMIATPRGELLLVGENGKGTNSSVVLVEPKSFSILGHLRHPQLQHPSGKSFMFTCLHFFARDSTKIKECASFAASCWSSPKSQDRLWRSTFQADKGLFGAKRFSNDQKPWLSLTVSG